MGIMENVEGKAGRKGAEKNIQLNLKMFLFYLNQFEFFCSFQFEIVFVLLIICLYVAHAVFKFVIFLPQLPECWHCGYVLITTSG